MKHAGSQVLDIRQKERKKGESLSYKMKTKERKTFYPITADHCFHVVIKLRKIKRNQQPLIQIPLGIIFPTNLNSFHFFWLIP